MDAKYDDACRVFYMPAILYIQCRIRKAKKEGMPIIDVDGSYLTRKIEKLKDSGMNTDPLKLPSITLLDGTLFL